jgi:hypothetical protein
MPNRANTSTTKLALAVHRELRTLSGRANLAELLERAAALENALADLVMLAAQHRGKAMQDSVRRARAAIAKAVQS